MNRDVQTFEIASLPDDPLEGGVERRRLVGDRLEFVHYRYPAGAVFARHMHAAEQLTIVVWGELVFAFDDEEIRVGAGEGILIPGGRPHGAYVPEEAGETATYNVFSPVRKQPPG